MDFHTLSRRDLQILCKKNHIPANLTNVAMADALQALKMVEGIAELEEALQFQSPKTNQKTASRKAAPTKEDQASPLPRSRRVNAKVPVLDDEKKKAVVENLETPRVPNTRRKVTKKEDNKDVTTVVTERRTRQTVKKDVGSEMISTGLRMSRRVRGIKMGYLAKEEVEKAVEAEKVVVETKEEEKVVEKEEEVEEKVVEKEEVEEKVVEKEEKNEERVDEEAGSKEEENVVEKEDEEKVDEEEESKEEKETVGLVDMKNNLYSQVENKEEEKGDVYEKEQEVKEINDTVEDIKSIENTSEFNTDENEDEKVEEIAEPEEKEVADNVLEEINSLEKVEELDTIDDVIVADDEVKEVEKEVKSLENITEVNLKEKLENVSEKIFELTKNEILENTELIVADEEIEEVEKEDKSIENITEVNLEEKLENVSEQILELMENEILENTELIVAEKEIKEVEKEDKSIENITEVNLEEKLDNVSDQIFKLTENEILENTELHVEKKKEVKIDGAVMVYEEIKEAGEEIKSLETLTEANAEQISELMEKETVENNEDSPIKGLITSNNDVMNQNLLITNEEVETVGESSDEADDGDFSIQEISISEKSDNDGGNIEIGEWIEDISHLNLSSKVSDNKENVNFIAIEVKVKPNVENFENMSLRKLKVFYREAVVAMNNNKGEEKRAALKVIDENCV